MVGKNPFCHGILLFYDPLKYNIVWFFGRIVILCCFCDSAKYTRTCLDEGLLLLLYFNMRKRKSMYDLPLLLSTPSIHHLYNIIFQHMLLFRFNNIVKPMLPTNTKCMHFHPPTENIMCGEWWCNSLNGNQSTKYGMFTVVHKCCKCLFTYLIYYDMLVFICQTHYCHLCFCSTLCKILTKHVDIYTCSETFFVASLLVSHTTFCVLYSIIHFQYEWVV